MKFGASVGFALVVALVGGCADEAPPTLAQGNQELGIASFKTVETPTMITIVGLDAKGQEAARVELTHGVFTLSPEHREDYDTDVVDGRKIKAGLGDHMFVFEREGYEPLMHMPAFPSSEADLAKLLADPHVKPVLDSWQLGFQTASTANVGEDAYDGYQKAGTLVQTCNNATACGTVTRTGDNAGTYGINTCGGGAVAAYYANRIAVTSTTVDEVAQCCPVSGGTTWSRKQCAKSGRQTPDCGTVTAGKACVGCGDFTANYNCYVGYASGYSSSSWQAACQPALCYYDYQCDPSIGDGCGGICDSYVQPEPGFCPPI